MSNLFVLLNSEEVGWWKSDFTTTEHIIWNSRGSVDMVHEYTTHHTPNNDILTNL